MLEPAWKGLHFLVRWVEINSNLKIYFCDVDKNELLLDLSSVDNLTDSIFYNLLNFDHSNFNFGTIIGGNYDFLIDVDETAMLARLAKIFQSLNAPFFLPSNRNFKTSCSLIIFTVLILQLNSIILKLNLEHSTFSC